MKLLAKIFALPTVIGLIPSTACASDQSLPVAVYDAMASPASGWAFGASPEIGQSVGLAGNARKITQIDVSLFGNGSDQFWIRLYGLDALTENPSGLIWQSPIQSYGATNPPFGDKIVSVTVPGVVVPDSVAWTVAPLEQSTSNLILWTGSPTPQVGTRIGVVLRQLDGNWVTAISDWTFGARLFAVPEPSSGSLAAVAGVVAICAFRLRQPNLGAALRI